jgi:hypothetical protein
MDDMRTVKDLVMRYAVEQAGKKESEVTGMRILEAPQYPSSKLRFVFEIIVENEHVRYVRRGYALITEAGITFGNIPSATRLTVPVNTVPLLGEIYTTGGEGPLVLFEEASTTDSLAAARPKHGGGSNRYFQPSDLVEASCFFATNGLYLAGVLVATTEQMEACGMDAVDMSNGCKFDTWEWGYNFSQKGECE